jgi:phosphoribosyl-AMP cyclohydrolase
VNDSINTKTDLETGPVFAPRFDDKGLITAVVSEAGTGAPLMVAYMNEQAIKLSVSSGEAHFWSRSRQEIWHKGGTSGNVLKIVEFLTDCDQDCLWLSVETKGHGAACHTGRKSCFYRNIVAEDGNLALDMKPDQPLFDPKDVYK